MSSVTFLPRVRGIEKAPPGALRAIVEVSNDLGWNPDWLASIIAFESGFDPKAVNKHSGASGAIQFMPSTAKNLGYTIEQIRAMSLEEQIRKPTWQYLKGFKGIKNLEDAYLTVFYPKAIGQPADKIVGRKDGQGFELAVYKQNAGFDKSNKGTITKSDITSTIRAVYNSSKGKPQVLVPVATFFDRPIVIFSLIGGIIAGAYLLVRYTASEHTVSSDIHDAKENLVDIVS